MKPNSRLLVRLTLPNGDMKGWGYDYPHYKTAQQLKDALIADFAEIPEHTDIHLFYDVNEEQITVENTEDLATQATEWMTAFGVFNGNKR